MNLTFPPGANGLGNETFFDHRGTVGKMELENVPAGFNVNAQGKGIVILLR